MNSDSAGPLAGKVAIVTGASRGIGKAIALAYAGAGASVGCGARTMADVEATVGRIESTGGKALAVQTDVTELESVARLVKATSDRFGGLDIIVVNAGGDYAHGSVESGDVEEWLATLDVNLIGAYYSARAAIPYLKQRGSGKIITIGSGMGHKGAPNASSYACAKAGLSMLTRVLAQELWQHSISVNELIPGPVVTERVEAAIAGRDDTVFSIDSEWVKTPEDVAPMALFLATQPDKGPTAQSYSLMRRDR